ncbi:MAG: indolepyruvate ferredoxin oxidoreductase family protein [Hyphomicrobiaceae bacterium]|nr:MAG: indolepyruvate ferredoxin oxidoreductase family protein [Hyphomicrobiaceae bacterium]
MPKSAVSLDDKFELDETRQLLTGTQAIVRLMLTQRARDVKAGLNTAGYVTGYRGSPIATLESAFLRAKHILEPNHIKFMAGLNEDLAATALWGSQQAELRGEGKYDGVFGVWYGKGPGVDRTGDVFRHANHAGTSKHGGVLALMGDDHTCESSTSAHQSEFAFLDAMIPVLNPGGVQEILDYGIYGFALSRFAGVWVGLKCVKDNIEATATVDGRVDRIQIKIPDDFVMPPGGLNIRLGDQALAKEARLHDHKRAAILAFARANKLDRIITSGGSNPKIGIITCGKSYLDVRQALDELGIDEVKANALGIRIYKVGMTWPLEPQGVLKFAEGLDLILVVEEKRSLIETQVKEQLYDLPVRPRVLGKKDENEQWLFPAKGALDPTDIAICVGERLIRYGAGDDVKARIADLKRLKGNRPMTGEAATRIPYFCPGCPHNTSTVVPEGSRAYAGIGCHFMAHWMDRNTEGFTQMGGEGTNWIGEAPFSNTRHVFQNLGDGTYIHSGSLAIRAAHAAGVNMTFKILYNDAVAMTGGQTLDGGISVPMIVNQVRAEGVEHVVIVTDEPHKYPRGVIPQGVPIYHRRDLQKVQRELREIPGVTALVYDQTCAAEKRRRRKRGLFPDPDRRVFINPAVCEGCGDCGVKSNCVAVSPLETELGTKRTIDQSACNKDFSCLNGFCPSFVTVHGAKVRKTRKVAGDAGVAHALAGIPEPALPVLDRPYTMLVTGVGGTGVVTVSAVLGQAAHLAGLGFGSIDMTGLAQKGGAVACHMRVAKSADQIHAIRAGVAGTDLVLGCDLVVTASNKVLETVKPDHTAIVYSDYEMMTADFARKADLKLPGAALRHAIEERAGKAPVHSFDAHTIAVKLFGDSIAANMFMLGYAYQLGHVPIGSQAIEQAIELNGAAVEMSRSAFRFGRLAAYDKAAIDRMLGPAATSLPKQQSLDDIIAYRATHLTGYQDAALAERYRAFVARVAEAERKKTPGRSALADAVARGYFKLLSYKDEYEVARLFADPAFEKALSDQFEARAKLEFHLAPPLLARRDKTTGEPRKMRFGPWMLPVFRVLAKGKALRGSMWDIFGYSAERRRERQMIADYEKLVGEIIERLGPATHATAVALAVLPLDVKGFGHIKDHNYKAAKAREAALLAELRNPSPPTVLKAAE